MKHIYKGLVLCATLAFAYTHTAAQEPLVDMLEATHALKGASGIPLHRPA